MSGQISQEFFAALSRAKPDRIAAALAVLQRRVPEPARQADHGPLLVGMAEASRILGISRTTFWNLIRAGKFRPIALTPTCRRIARRDLDDFIASARTGATAKPVSDAAAGAAAR